MLLPQLNPLILDVNGSYKPTNFKLMIISMVTTTEIEEESEFLMILLMII
jgi:hypothetical protein